VFKSGSQPAACANREKWPRDVWAQSCKHGILHLERQIPVQNIENAFRWQLHYLVRSISPPSVPHRTSPDSRPLRCEGESAKPPFMARSCRRSSLAARRPVLESRSLKPLLGIQTRHSETDCITAEDFCNMDLLVLRITSELKWLPSPVLVSHTE
jgi:hypothetical protein